MTILNVEIDKKKKDKIKEIAKSSIHKTISEFVRSSIDERLQIEEITKNKIENIEIPEWIPDGKYIAFVNGAIASVGETVSEVSRDSAEKFPGSSVVIKRKGELTKTPEYVFSAFTELKCWNYSPVEDRTYPLISLKIGTNDDFKTIRALPDSAASISVLKDTYIKQLNLTAIRTEEIGTMAGPIQSNVMEILIKIEDLILKSEVLEGQISDKLPFDLLLGRNVLDLLDIYLLGKKQVICLKDP